MYTNHSQREDRQLEEKWHEDTRKLDKIKRVIIMLFDQRSSILFPIKVVEIWHSRTTYGDRMNQAGIHIQVDKKTKTTQSEKF